MVPSTFFEGEFHRGTFVATDEFDAIGDVVTHYINWCFVALADFEDDVAVVDLGGFPGGSTLRYRGNFEVTIFFPNHGSDAIKFTRKAFVPTSFFHGHKKVGMRIHRIGDGGDKHAETIVVAGFVDQAIEGFVQGGFGKFTGLNFQGCIGFFGGFSGGFFPLVLQVNEFFQGHELQLFLPLLLLGFGIVGKSPFVVVGYDAIGFGKIEGFFWPDWANWS